MKINKSYLKITRGKQSKWKNYMKINEAYEKNAKIKIYVKKSHVKIKNCIINHIWQSMNLVEKIRYGNKDSHVQKNCIIVSSGSLIWLEEQHSKSFLFLL